MKGQRGRVETAESKRRRDGHHCPVCLKALPRMAGQERRARKCASCGAQPEPGQRCARCRQEAIWEAGPKAACQSCGTQGSRFRVVAGALEDDG
jgi:hypothetical protein